MAPGHRAVGYDHDSHKGVEGNERRTKVVIAVTAVVMVVELVVGMWSGSLALTADGWHMATHAGALGLSAVAYWFARTHADRKAFAFGTGKVYALAGFSSAVLLAVAAVWMGVEAVQRLITPQSVRFDEALVVAVLGLVVNLVSIWLLHAGGHALAGFSSAVLLAVAAVWMAVEAVQRLITPQPVRFDEALVVAVLGLVVNLVSIWLLHAGGHVHPGHEHDHGPAHRHDRDHDHAHDHHHDHAHDHHHDHDHGRAGDAAPGGPAAGHGDHSLRAVYLHVLADALTSVLAIFAIAAGRYLGWHVLDPIMALLGGALILRWSIGLGRDAAAQLVDATRDVALEQQIALTVGGFDGAEVVDLHTWRTGPQHRACIVVVACGPETTAGTLRAAILGAATIEHLTVEVHPRGALGPLARGG